MIHNPDRSGWFGASDTNFVIAKNRNTKSWQNWWLEKLDLHKNEFSSKAMAAGSAWEHKILDAVDPAIRKDHQITIEKYRLRVNYDGDKDGVIYEVKTYDFNKGFKYADKTKDLKRLRNDPYWRQSQVEMYAMKTTKLYIVAYGLIPEEYDNYFLPVDDKRIKFYRVEYDKQWIQNEYLPNLKDLCRALRKGRFPT